MQSQPKVNKWYKIYIHWKLPSGQKLNRSIEAETATKAYQRALQIVSMELHGVAYRFTYHIVEQHLYVRSTPVEKAEFLASRLTLTQHTKAQKPWETNN